MRAWLLTWNPDKWHWEDYEKDCEKASKEKTLDGNWSSQSKQTQAGDEFYLMKQGKKPRGIIAHGFLTGHSFDDYYWDEQKVGKKTHYVDIKIDTLLNYREQEILYVSILDEVCPNQQWHPFSSGIRIRDEVLPKLHELWTGVTMEYPDNPEESIYDEEIDHTDNGRANSISETGSGTDGVTGTAGIIEGTKKAVYTTTYERNPKIRRAFLKGKKLRCEVCGFDFEKAYGKLGAGFIEVHHKKPVSEGEQLTDLNNDLVMLCSNCHRMIHRGKDHMITVEELKGVIQDSTNKD